ncbi:cuticle protein 10.9-like [Tachypleus tridentatus]|uniref:cuticle protein 10.9-like n=1 Tax=Tachypleus tridentatus TaxID=6853 RepID=UPI003FD30DE2
MLKAIVFLAVVAGALGGKLLAYHPVVYSHPDPYAAPEPFDFGFQTTDEFGTQLSRQESGDASGAVSGSYGYADANGIWRKVTYNADAGGFRAQVDTNEPGTDSKNPADVTVNANPAPAPVVYKHPVVKHVIPAAHVYAPYHPILVKHVKAY